MSAVFHSTLSTVHFGSRRAMPRIDSTSGSRASRRTRLEPWLPVAPTTTMRIGAELPSMWDFSTEPEFQAHLDWMREFVRDEIWPLEVLDLDYAQLMRAMEPLQEQVRERGLW